MVPGVACGLSRVRFPCRRSSSFLRCRNLRPHPAGRRISSVCSALPPQPRAQSPNVAPVRPVQNFALPLTYAVPLLIRTTYCGGGGVHSLLLRRSACFAPSRSLVAFLKPARDLWPEDVLHLGTVLLQVKVEPRGDNARIRVWAPFWGGRGEVAQCPTCSWVCRLGFGGLVWDGEEVLGRDYFVENAPGKLLGLFVDVKQEGIRGLAANRHKV